MYKQVENGYILSIGTTGNVEITEAEYDSILAVIRTCPNEPGKGYRLKTDLTWESYDLPEPTTEDEITPEEIAEEIREVL